MLFINEISSISDIMYIAIINSFLLNTDVKTVFEMQMK